MGMMDALLRVGWRPHTCYVVCMLCLVKKGERGGATKCVKDDHHSHSWARTPRILRARGGVYYIKFVRYYNGIRRLGGVHNPDPLRAQV